MITADRVALVTGATAGIGLQTALGLAQAGVRVIVAGRDRARTEAARRLIEQRAGGAAAVETALADFAGLAEVRRLADAVLTRHDRLDVLVNNAGLISRQFTRSRDGIELSFAVNHLAPFLLTNLLLDRLKASAAAGRAPRIVTVASTAHRGARITDPAELANPRDWGPLRAYGRSKLCNILFTRALAKRLEGTGVVAVCLHPGVIATAIGDNAGRFAGWGWRLVKPVLRSPKQGAETSLFLATVADAHPFHGAYVVGTRSAKPDAAALDDGLAERLWAESARLVGLA